MDDSVYIFILCVICSIASLILLVCSTFYVRKGHFFVRKDNQCYKIGIIQGLIMYVGSVTGFVLSFLKFDSLVLVVLTITIALSFCGLSFYPSAKERFDKENDNKDQNNANDNELK